MEAIVAVGLASNVLQFVDFATKLVSKARGLRQAAASSDHKDYDAIAAHLQVLAGKVSASAHSIAQLSSSASPQEKALQPLADGCCELAKKLSERLDKLGLSSAQSSSLLRRGKMAWRWVWNKKETEEIVERLHYFGSQLALHMTYQIKQSQLEQRIWQSSKDDTQAVLAKTNDVLLSIEGLRLGVHEKLNKQHGDILKSIADGSALNSRLQAQTTREVSLASQATSKGIHDLEASLSTLMLKQNDDMKTYNAEVLESLATIRVDNSKLYGQATQVLPQNCNFDTTSFQHILGSMLDEYKENIITDIRKEFRGTALSEMESLRTQTLQALNSLQSDRQTRISNTQSAPELVAESPSSYSSMLTQNTISTEEEVHELKDHRRQKKDIAMIHTYNRRIKTRIGILRFKVKDTVIFDPVKPPVSVYELTAHFILSPRWCSKGFFVTYEKVTDSRGTPKFGLQFKPYRVLDDDHRVWKVIHEHDIDSLRSMLRQREISTYDRNKRGITLLIEAVQWGQLDIVKALVHSGADINATDPHGMSPICWAILYDLMKLASFSGQEVFSYLRGLSNINLSDLWLNWSLLNFAITSIGFIRQDTDVHDLKKALLNWVSICRAVDFDFDVPGKMTFLESIVSIYGIELFAVHGGHQQFNLITAFDLLLDEVVSICPIVNSEIPMSYAAFRLIGQLIDASEGGYISSNTSTILSVPYHGYYVKETFARALNFLEHVMAKAIAQRPDCIFDLSIRNKFPGDTICTMFDRSECWDFWADILKDNGFDPDWVKQEDIRRRCAMTADTSTHEVSGHVDAAQALKVKRRRGYADGEE